jgi:hypothetical protein
LPDENVNSLRGDPGWLSLVSAAHASSHCEIQREGLSDPRRTPATGRWGEENDAYASQRRKRPCHRSLLSTPLSSAKTEARFPNGFLESLIILKQCPEVGVGFVNQLKPAENGHALDEPPFTDRERFIRTLKQLGFGGIDVEDKWKFTHVQARKTERRPREDVELEF